MTAPRPYSEKPRWDEIGAITVIAGAIATAASLLVGFALGAKTGVATIVAGVIIRMAAAMVWEP